MSSLILVAALFAQQQQAAIPVRAAGPAPSAAAVASDTGSLRHPNGRVPPITVAVRAAAGSPRIDGRLDDPVWAAAEPVTQLAQQTPNDGDSATERTEVRVAYDDDALYVAARMFDREPGRIDARLGRRDAGTQSDDFEVAIDSYHDHRTAFFFQTNPLGVKYDAVFANDFQGGDDSWDPVWEVATQRDSLGWTAEFRIPLSQLRFPNTPTQVWGINFIRWLRRKGENSIWAYSSQTDQGYASFFGHLFGLENLPQPRRLEVMPYAAAIEERTAAGTPGNPFNDGSREVGRAGLDVKYGLTSNLTLNATVNPDFGQVEADPAEMNISVYETYLSERRPFFVEGSNIFQVVSPGFIQGSGPQYVYSRRIGRAPQGWADYRGEDAFTDQPTSTTILGAGKLSGRTGGWSVGLLEAVTAAEYATTDSAGVRFRDPVEPLTNFGVLRASRDMNGGTATLGVTGTSVNRRLNDDRLDFLRSAAYAGGVDYSRRLSRNRFSLFAALGYSYIRGDTLAIRSAQRSSARYYQRPDRHEVLYDATRTSLAGWSAALGFSKDEGATNYSITADATSPGFEVNDLGYQTRADRVNLYLWSGRRWTRPGRVFRFATMTGSSSLAWNHDGNRLGTSFSASAYGQFLNFWSVSAYGGVNLRSLSDNLTRGGPLATSPAGWSVNLGVNSDFRKPWQAYASVYRSGNELGGWGAGGYASLTYRPTSSVALTLGPSYSSSHGMIQYVASSADPTAGATYGRRYVFADILQRSLDLTGRLNVTVSPTLSLQLYAQPFIATGDYRRFKELLAARTTDYLVYGEAAGSTTHPVTDTAGAVVGYELDPDGSAGARPVAFAPNLDFSYRSLRGNAVLRWEYRPGSTLFLVWTTSCSSSSSSPSFDALNDVRRLCQGRSDNVFAVKLNYWMSL